MIVAVVAVVAAGFFLWRRDVDKAFVLAALGAVAWFLNYRTQLRELVATADANNEELETENEDHDDLED
ncbi:MAG TPA: hypothetical protein VLL54_11280 [Pyrinomonadaceae bacterium]|nr:hypothetical protein [Pyrinomonadaceae bacterium]